MRPFVRGTTGGDLRTMSNPISTTQTKLIQRGKRLLARCGALILGMLLGTVVGAVAHADTQAAQSAMIAEELSRWDQIGSEAPEVSDEADASLSIKDLVGDEKPGSGDVSTRMLIEVFKRPVGLGIAKEFMVISVDDQVIAAHVVSTGMNGKPTIEGSFPLTAMKLSGYGTRLHPERKAPKPYPFVTSSKYANSPMYWGVQVHEGYWVHSTPHYGFLGGPASMGCVRTSYPTAMEIFDLVVNKVDGSAKTVIYGSDTVAKRTVQHMALDRVLKQVNLQWITEQVESDLADALALFSDKLKPEQKDYKGYGHARRGKTLEFPKCADVDCFDYFGKTKPI